MTNRNCPVCNKPIIGRVDKKYCSDQCRSDQNNVLKNPKVILDINKQLRKNRTILKSLCPDGKATVHKEVLQARGYQFHIFSSIFITKEKRIYYICYDIAFMPVISKGMEKAFIVSFQDARKNWNPWSLVRPTPP